jgi:hypothetical protein
MFRNKPLVKKLNTQGVVTVTGEGGGRGVRMNLIMTYNVYNI